MSASSAPFGFRPAYHPSGLIRAAAAFPDGISAAYNTALLQGQLVTLNTDGTLKASVANTDILGVFAGVEYTPSPNGRPVWANQWPASQAYVAGTLIAYAWVDPQIVYEVQADGSLAATSVGDQADVSNATAGSTTTGLSQATLSASLAGAGVQAQFRILGLAPSDGSNAWGDAYTIVQVQIARQQYVANKVAI